ncbi:MAG: metal ABC transporter substrate-binding protein [Actinomycetota bacterium]
MARLVSLTLIAALLGAACGPGAGGDPARSQVVASFYPLAFAAGAIGGDAAEVLDLTPPGGEPHDLELTSSQVLRLSEADVVFYLGAGFQPAVEQALDDVDGRVVDLLPEGEEHAGEDDADDADDADADADHDHEGADPHVWLDPVEMSEVVRTMVAELVALDDGNRATYEGNGRALLDRLDALHAEYTEGLADCESRVVITAHDAFGHLAERYDLEEIGIAGIDPEAEPSPQRLVEVAELARERGVTTIFFERLLPTQVAEIVADRAGVETSVLDPIETAPDDGDYLGAMRANLDALREALQCE